MRNFTLSSAYIIAPITFLSIFQFAAATLSITQLPFTLNILFSFTVAVLATFIITREFKESILCTRKQVLVVLILSIALTSLFILRLNYEIFDFTCLTGLLGLITQVTEGHFPVSYHSFPDLTMNYHQGFIFLTGIFTILFQVPIAAATKIVLASLFFFLNLAITLYFIGTQNRFYYLPPMLFLLIASVSSPFHNLFGIAALPSVSIFEFSNSSSWPLGLLTVIVLLFIGKTYKQSPKHLFLVCLLILSIATINATLFQLIFISSILIAAVSIVSAYRNGNTLNGQTLLLFLAAAMLLLLIPKVIPSAMMLGDSYGSPQLQFNFFAYSLQYFFYETVQYFFLTGPLPIIVLIATPFVLLRTSSTYVKLYILLLVTLLFPVVFSVKNMYSWNAVHKFALLSIFLSIILAVAILGNLRKFKSLFKLTILFSAIVSFTTVYQISLHYVSLDFYSYNKPSESMRDVVLYLKDHPSLLIPFNNQPNVFCDLTGYAAVAQYSGNFIRDAYNVGFLLNEDVEAQYTTNASWANFNKKSQAVHAELQNGATLIVEKNLLDPDTLLLIEREIPANKKEFSHYILYRTEPW